MIDKYLFIVNGRFLTQKMTGVHRYAYEMCCAFKRAEIHFLVVAPKKILADYEICFDLETCGISTSHIWEQIELPIYLNKKYKNHLLISLTGLGSVFYKKMICTIHDISYLIHPEWFSKSYYYVYKWLTPITAKRALKVITVSEFSKEEINSRLNVSKEKIIVIYNAVTSKVILNKKQQISPDKFVLTVSSLDPRKNFKRLIQAYNLLNNKNCKLYIIGKKDKVFRNINFEGLENNPNIVFTGYVTDEQLAQYYSEASLFVYPSLYEGFGIPNLEAMMNMCPVVISDIPPHKEVCGSAAVYFNQYDVKDMADKISYVLNNNDLQKNMIQRGKERASLFSWDKSANKLVTLIKEL